MKKRVLSGFVGLCMAGALAGNSLAAPPKVQLQYLAFPANVVEDSTGAIQLVMVNNGQTADIINDGGANTDEVLVSVPLGAQAADLINDTTGLFCSAQNAAWDCRVQVISPNEARVSMYPAAGAVTVAQGDTLTFYLNNTIINGTAGMTTLAVTQNIDSSRALNPVNDQMSILKVTTAAASFLEIDPTVDPSVKDGVDWTELSGIPAGFADNTDNGITTETDPTVLASVKDGVDWTEVTGIPAGFADGTDNGLTSESDPTVLASVKDGVDWTEVTNIPAGFADNTDDGITTETDPTVPANIKDGIDWSELSGVPASLQDGDQVGLTSESDPQVGNNTTNRIPKWNGSALVGSNSINEDAGGNVGVGTSTPTSKLDVAGDTKISGVLTSGKIQIVDVVTEGSGCSPNGLIARDSAGLMLSCQSGVWAKASGSSSGGTGLSGVFYPLRGKSMSCTMMGTMIESYTYVDNNGYPYVRVRNSSYDTGWVQSTSITAWSTSAKITSTSLSGSHSSIAGTYSCSSVWPLN